MRELKYDAYAANSRGLHIIDPIHAAAMMNKNRGLAGRFTANLHVST